MHRPQKAATRTCAAVLKLGVLVALAAGGAAPACVSPACAATTGTINMQFDGYAHGLIVLKVAGTLELTQGGYSGQLTLRTAGMINWLSHMDSNSQVLGHFQGADVVPQRYDSAGTARGVYREMHVGFPAGKPVIERQVPPVDDQHTLVPPSDAAGAIDTLSAMALLVRRVGAGGTCDGNLRLFDGRRLTALTAHTVGKEMLPPSPKTHFDGQALRCDFEGTRLAGFARADDMAQQRKPRHGSAWLAPIVPGAPPVPVRVTFDNKVLGSVTLYLTSVTGGPGAIAQNATGSAGQ
jgi:hypothetical protein